jgi:VIT1/CCC1 family predicted Fe2+/Mn2+ transporter
MSENVHYIDEPTRNRPISATVNEAKEEFKRFAETRIAMLQSEMKEKTSTLKASAPMMTVGGLLAITGFWVLTAALICLVWVIFTPSAYAMFLACLIVGAIYAIAGFAALMLGYQNIRRNGVMPNRTIKVLKEDKIWLQSEARNIR